MRARAPGMAVVAALCAGLGAAGCGGDGNTRTGAGTTGPPAATPARPGATPPRTSTLNPGPAGAEHRHVPRNGGEEPVRVPATLTLRGGRLSPPTVSVPPFLAIRVSVRNLDSRPRTLTIRAERSYRLTVGPGGRAARTLPGQRAGSYPVEVPGGGRATLVVGGEPGP